MALTHFYGHYPLLFLRTVSYQNYLLPIKNALEVQYPTVHRGIALPALGL